MNFAMPPKQVTVVYASEYVSAANVIEARVQAFIGFQSRLWEVEEYVANKCTLDSDQLVLFLGNFEENAAAKAYKRVFEAAENVYGCIYSIAGSKALIYATGEAPTTQPSAKGAHFYCDSDGNTRTTANLEALHASGASILRHAAKVGFGGVGGWVVEKLTPQLSISRQEQLETGCEQFMKDRFARWVGYNPV